MRWFDFLLRALLGALLVTGAVGLSMFLGFIEMRGESSPMFLGGVSLSAAGPMISVVMALLGMSVLYSISPRIDG